MTIVRKHWKNRVNAWLDHYLIIHKFCGYLVTFYGIVHSLWHIFGSFRIITNEEDLEELNGYMARKEFDDNPTYVGLLFGTLPGITGLMLLTIIWIMAITSTRYVRHRCFQVFGYTHNILFPIFCALLIIHGFGFWFSIGIPFGIVFITPGYSILIVQQLMRVFSNTFNHFHIVDISVSFDCSYIMIHLKKPEHYKLIHGQYVFMNIPAIHPLQWHPFTVASSPSSPYLTLMIKKAGDWTGRLIKRLQHDKMRIMNMSEFSFDSHSQYDVFNLLHDLHRELSLKEMEERNRHYFPAVKITRACSTPNDTFISRKDVIMIGAGSGISPYLPLLEEVIRDNKGKKSKFDFNSARLIFVAREGEQISWISNFLFHILSSDWMIPKLEFNIFITIDRNLQNLHCFLFWRAFLLISLWKQVQNRASNDEVPTFKYDDQNLFVDKSEFDNSPVKVIFGRPNFEALFKASIKPNVKKMYVYSTTSPQLNQHLFNTVHKVEKETGVKFKHIYESTS